MNGYEQMISERLKDQDEREFALGDTLDIKTSIALVIITFLATQSAEFLKTTLSPYWHIIQRVSVGCIVIAGVESQAAVLLRSQRRGVVRVRGDMGSLEGRRREMAGDLFDSDDDAKCSYISRT